MLPERRLAGLCADGPPHTFLHRKCYSSSNPELSGVFLGQRASFFALRDLELGLGVLLSRDGGEFELLENTYFVSLSWYF